MESLTLINGQVLVYVVGRVGDGSEEELDYDQSEYRKEKCGIVLREKGSHERVGDRGNGWVCILQALLFSNLVN